MTVTELELFCSLVMCWGLLAKLLPSVTEASAASVSMIAFKVEGFHAFASSDGQAWLNGALLSTKDILVCALGRLGALTDACSFVPDSFGRVFCADVCVHSVPCVCRACDPHRSLTEAAALVGATVVLPSGSMSAASSNA